MQEYIPLESLISEMFSSIKDIDARIQEIERFIIDDMIIAENIAKMEKRLFNLQNTKNKLEHIVLILFKQLKISGDLNAIPIAINTN